jgi:dGTPase
MSDAVPDWLLPDGSICNPEVREKRYGRPFVDGQLSAGDAQWAAGDGFWRGGDARTPTERDRGRLRYTNSLYRLAGVTQVISPPIAFDFFHNRLSHSLKVGDLAGAMAAEKTRTAIALAADGDMHLLETIVALGGLDVAACESAGLAHDLGHPPFGHVAEGAIDRWLREGVVGEQRCGNGFEGNAQTFRSVTRLSLRDDATTGLELTAVTLAGILKYPWLREIGSIKREGKFGAYHADGGVRDAARSWFEDDLHHDDITQTLEASVMDLADDITYAIHDLQDFLSAKVISAAEVSADLRSCMKLMGDGFALDDLEHLGNLPDDKLPQEDGLTVAKKLDELKQPGGIGVNKLIGLASRLSEFYPGHYHSQLFIVGLATAVETVASFDGAAHELQREAALRHSGSELIRSLMKDVLLEPKSGWAGGPHLYLARRKWHLVQILKEITKSYVVDTPAVGLHQESETESLMHLLDGLERWVERARKLGFAYQLPPDLQLAIQLAENSDRFSRRSDGERNYDDNPVSRAIVDYCCSLTDAAAHKMSLNLRGAEVARTVL